MKATLRSIALLTACALMAGCSQVAHYVPSPSIATSQQGARTVAASWSLDLNDGGEPLFREFDGGITEAIDTLALWFKDRRERGVLVYRLDDDNKERLVGIDDRSGELIWERRLSLGFNRCSYASSTEFLCISNPYPGTSYSTSELTMIEGTTGHTTDAWELNFDQYIDDATATPDGLYAITRDRSSTPLPVTLQYFTRGRLSPDRTTSLTSQNPLEYADRWQLDISKALGRVTIQSTSDVYEASITSRPQATTPLRRADARDRSTSRLSRGWELVRERGKEFDFLWSLVSPDGDETLLGQGTPWRSFEPGPAFGLNQGTIGFNNLRSTIGEKARPNRLKSREITDFYLYASAVPGQVYVITGDDLIARDAETGQTAWRRPNDDPFRVASARSFVVAIGNAADVYDLTGSQIAHEPLEDDFDEATPTITSEGFAITGKGTVRGYRVSE